MRFFQTVALTGARWANTCFAEQNFNARLFFTFTYEVNKLHLKYQTRARRARRVFELQCLAARLFVPPAALVIPRRARDLSVENQGQS